MTYESNLSSSIPTATSRPYGHEHEREKHHDHGPHTLTPPSTTIVTASATSTIGTAGILHKVRSAGSETVITFTSTSLLSSVFTTTSDGHPVTGTILVPVTTTSASTSTILPTPTNKASLPASAPPKSRINPLVPAIIGSLVGALALLGVGILLYIRRRRRRSMFHKINPLIDIEETVSIQRHQQSVQLETQARMDAEARTKRGQLPQKTPRHHDLNHENVLVPTPEDNNPDRDRDVRSQMEEMRTEMRVTMGRMMEHVQRIEAQIESGRDGREGPGDLESVTSDARPPTYVSS